MMLEFEYLLQWGRSVSAYLELHSSLPGTHYHPDKEVQLKMHLGVFSLDNAGYQSKYRLHEKNQPLVINNECRDPASSRVSVYCFDRIMLS